MQAFLSMTPRKTLIDDKIQRNFSSQLTAMNPLRPRLNHWRQIYRLLHHPALRYVLNLRANIASLSFITCSLPLFLMGQVTTGIALSLGSIACGLADTASVSRHRVIDFVITLVLFFLNSLAVVLLFSHTAAFVAYIGLSSFFLFMLALYSPRLGGIGFATILLGIYTMILHSPTLSIWHLPLALSIGAIWYGLWQWLANRTLPGQEDRDLLYEIFQSLGRKLQSHAWPLTHSGDYNTFVETARLRAVYSAKFNALQNRVNQQLSAGENRPELGRLLSAMKAADSVSEQTRLMHFTPSPAFQAAHSDWLEKIDRLTREMAESLRSIKPGNSGFTLPDIDFTALRQAPEDDSFRRESLLALGFIDKLELIYIALAELKTDSVHICRPHPATDSGAHHCHFSWRTPAMLWQRFISQMTLDSSYFRHALRGALCLTVGLIIVRWYDLEFGFWTLMTSLLVLRPNLSMTWSRLLHRLGGTLSGLAVVALMLHWQVHSLTLLLVFCLAAIVFFHTSARQYGISVFCVTLFVFSGFALNGQGNIILLPRLENTLLGVALPIIFVFFIAPGWQKHAFPSQLLNTVNGYLGYLTTLKQQLQSGSQADAALLEENFRLCVRNDTNLFDHWLGYLAEPRPRNKTSEAIVLCCRSSNIMLRLLTRLHHGPRDNSMALQQALDLTISDFTHLLEGLQRSHTSPHFFDYLSDHQAEITPKLKELEHQSGQLTMIDILHYLRQEVEILGR